MAEKETTTFTEEQVASMVAEQLETVKQEHQAELEKVRAEAKKAGVDEGKKFADLTEAEKLKQQLADVEKELTAVRAENTHMTLASLATQQLTEAGVTVTDELVSLMVKEDAEQTKAAIEQFTGALEVQLKAAEKERMKGDDPKVKATTNSLTKDEIMAVADTAKRQQLINENLDLFK